MKKLFAAAAMVVFGLVTESMVRAQVEIAVGDEVLAALRVVEDKDGFTNVRSGASVKSAVAGRVNTGSVVAVEAIKGDWAKVADDSGRNRPLFVHASRLKPVKGWRQSRSETRANAASAKIGQLEVKVTAMAFVKENHRITKDGNGLALVDGRRIWGTDGGLPEAGISLAVFLDGKMIEVPAVATRDLFQPDLASLVMLTHGRSGEHAVVVMQNSDGAGAYSVAWALVGGKYVGRTVFTLE